MMTEFCVEMRIYQLAVSNNNVGTNMPEMVRAFNSPKVPESKSFSRARDVREIENFLFDMEQYFETTNVGANATKVMTAIMYLKGNTKVWRRT